MVDPSDINLSSSPEGVEQRLLDRAVWSYLTAEQVGAERAGGRDVLLKGRLRAALLRLNEWMTEPQAERVIFEIENVNAVGMAGNRAVHQHLAYGMPLTVDGPSGREMRVARFFDFDHPEDGLNDFVVASEFPISETGQDQHAPATAVLDMVLFVNGLPLVVVEVKPGWHAGRLESAALQQVLRYVQTAPHLFHCNLLCILYVGGALVCVAPGGPETASFRWEPRSLQTADPNQQGSPPPVLDLLSPATLLDILRDYVVYEAHEGRLVKRLPQYHQYRAVTAAMRRIQNGGTHEDRGGIIAHTAGSGRQSTMMWLATKLRRGLHLANPTIVMVAEFHIVADMISQTFQRSGMPVPERISSIAGLRSVLTDGAGRTVISTLQTFARAIAPSGPELMGPDNAGNVVVLADELDFPEHNRLGITLSQVLPTAILFGFSGVAHESVSRRRAPRMFGEVIDSYSMNDAVADDALVPVWYEERLPSLAVGGGQPTEQLFENVFGGEDDLAATEIRRGYFNRETLAESDQRIQMVASDIAEHFRENVRPNGFKALVFASSRTAAVRYAKCLNDLKVSAYPFVRAAPDDGPEFQTLRDVDQRQIISDFADPEKEPAILVVTDTLPFAIDVPVQQVIYLDQELHRHEYQQMAGRAGRRFSHEYDEVLTEKTYGLVVDYHGTTGFTEGDPSSHETVPESTMRPPQSGSPADVATLCVQAESYFAGRDIDDVRDCAGVFRPAPDSGEHFDEDVFRQFNTDYRRLSLAMDRMLPDPGVLPYVIRLARLTEIRGYVRTLYLREDGGRYWADVGAKVKGYLNEHVNTAARPLVKPLSLQDEAFDSKINELSHAQARALELEHSLRAFVREHRSNNPMFYEELSQQLERIVRDLRNRTTDVDNGVQRMIDLKSQLLREPDVAAAHGLTPVGFAIYELIQEGDRAELSQSVLREENGTYQTGSSQATAHDLASDVERRLDRYLNVVDWSSNPDVQRKMRRDVKRCLRPTREYSEDDLSQLARSIVDVIRRRGEG